MPGLARHCNTEATTSAPPEAVWRIVSDVTRVGEWSHECQGARWARGAHEAAPGARFRGRNRSGIFRWSRSCAFTVVNPPRVLAWRTGGLLGLGDRTEWRITLDASSGGTRIVQTYDVVHVAPLLDRLYWRLIKGHRDRRDALGGDLRRLAALAEAEGAAKVRANPSLQG